MHLEHIQTFEQSYTCPVHWHRFKNGPDVLVGERKSQFVTVQITLPVGALRDEIPGTAHVLEHAKMKGQCAADGVHPKLFELSLEGVHGNAMTSHEFVEYFLTGPVTHLDRMLETITSIAFESQFREAQIIRERGPIVQEYAQNERRERYHLWRKRVLIPDSGFARSVIGTPETIRRVDLECLRAFNEKWYGWNTASVIAVGGVEAKNVHEIVSEILPRFPKQTEYPRLSPVAGRAMLARHEYVGDDIATPGMEINFPYPIYRSRDDFLLGIVTEILGFPRVGLLNHELRGKRRMVYDVGVSNVSFPYRVFSVRADLHPAKFEDYERIVHGCVAMVADDVYPEYLLAAIFRRRQLGRMQRAESSKHGALVDVLRDQWLRDFRDDIDYLQLFEKTSRQDISRVAKKYLQNVKSGTIIRLPK